ncbi:MAG: type II toxin-antitoxin system HicA family toxin [Deltaproteobacteria bacterium]|nr:type II toxin-antitoxin system HicA family toxin [Deltaproteobacteria bacterium]
MGRLQTTGAAELVRALRRLGDETVRQKGSHISLRAVGRPPLTVPAHEPVAPGTLRAIIRAAGIDVDELLALLQAG